jgi:hypothetical protein
MCELHIDLYTFTVHHSPIQHADVTNRARFIARARLVRDVESSSSCVDSRCKLLTPPAASALKQLLVLTCEFTLLLGKCYDFAAGDICDNHLTMYVLYNHDYILENRIEFYFEKMSIVP